jgi:hypothetical protein
MIVAEAAVIDAPPAVVYGVLADYRQHHPRILPPGYFTGLDVEEGGFGAGTVMLVHMRALGQTRVFRMVASEPEPGRVLVETDHDRDVETTFTVDPVDGGQRSAVTIATAWTPKGGLAGLGDRLVTPPIMRRIYREELRRLNTYAHEATVSGQATARERADVGPSASAQP